MTPTDDLDESFSDAAQRMLGQASERDAEEADRLALAENIRKAAHFASGCRQFLTEFQPWETDEDTVGWTKRVNWRAYAGRWVREAWLPLCQEVSETLIDAGALDSILAIQPPPRDKKLLERAQLVAKAFNKILLDPNRSGTDEVIANLEDLLEAEPLSVEQYHWYFENLATNFATYANGVEDGRVPIPGRSRSPSETCALAGETARGSSVLPSPKPETLQSAYSELSELPAEAMFDRSRVAMLFGLALDDPKELSSSSLYVERSGRDKQPHQLPRSGRKERRGSTGAFAPSTWSWSRDEVLGACRGWAKRLGIELASPF